MRLVVLICGILLPILATGQSRSETAPSARTGTTAQKSPQFDGTVTMKFDIPDLVTDHQFPGQTNTFHVQYSYGRILKGGAFDPSGRPVAADTYPYFQTVRQEMINFIKRYTPKDDFYEVFTQAIAEDLMTHYPQIARLEVSVEIPAYGGVLVPRGVSVVLTRH